MTYEGVGDADTCVVYVPEHGSHDVGVHILLPSRTAGTCKAVLDLQRVEGTVHVGSCAAVWALPEAGSHLYQAVRGHHGTTHCSASELEFTGLGTTGVGKFETQKCRHRLVEGGPWSCPGSPTMNFDLYCL